ncbi:type IX secretion system membrane protein PorP/SprF [Mucilaginibacter limnophilus]|uniref:Type IX secretion system membrane protein PorP/SprF n=2 Tax=Mucilaginibacter limnophilus TaxID=1932778 RepID=A0A437MWQ2_9SPHI|nr:type IX secretion system membrane protein PorP/SprF [Mucilaginibacter limnophilus]
MRRFLFISILLLSTVVVYAQQDAQQSQYMFNGIYINPAYAGYKENLNLHAYYRSQWTDVPGSPRSMSLAIDAIANDGNVGLAFQIANDKLGAQHHLSAYGNYAYRLRMNEDGSSRLALGLGFGFVQTGINTGMLNPNDPEPDLSGANQNAIAPDARLGVFYSDNKFYAGISADNLISQFIDVKKSGAYIAQPKPHYYLTAGMLLGLSEDIMLKPSFLLKDDVAGPTSLDLNAFLLLGEKVWLGGSYRTGVKIYDKSHLQNNLTPANTVVAAIEVFPTQNLRIGYGYDFNNSPLTGSGASHEISIGFYFKTGRSRMLTPRYF